MNVPLSNIVLSDGYTHKFVKFRVLFPNTPGPYIPYIGI